MGEEGRAEKGGAGEEGGAAKSGAVEEGWAAKGGVGEEVGGERGDVGVAEEGSEGEGGVLCSEQMNVLVYCCLVRPVQCRCIQCGVGWLQRTDVCVRVCIFVLHTPHIHTWAGPGFLSTSPAKIRRRAWSIPQASPVPESPPVCAANPAGRNWGRLTEKTVFGPPFRGAGIRWNVLLRIFPSGGTPTSCRPFRGASALKLTSASASAV